MLKLQAPNRWISMLLAVVLLLTLAPLSPAHAAVSFTFDNYSTEENAPTQVNSDTIELTGTFHGVASNSIVYKVEQIVNGQVAAATSGTGITPIIEGLNRYRFTNVKLFSGLNKITLSGTASGSVVTGEAYVSFPNVPTIYDIKLIDDRPLQANRPTIVDTPTITLMFKAPNSTGVTVQGRSAFSGGGENYLISDIELQPGLNTLVFTASNSTMTYSIERDVVLFDAMPTAYNVRVTGGTPASVKLDNNPTVGPNTTSPESLSGTLQGSLVVRTDPGNTPVVNIRVTNSADVDIASSPLTTTVAFSESVTVTGATYTYSIYNFTSTAPLPTNGIAASGEYRLYVQGTYGAENINYPMVFNYRSQSSPYITEVRQLYNVTEPADINDPAARFSYTSSSLFVDNLAFFQAPVWIAVKVENFNRSLHTATLTSTQGGIAIGEPDFTYQSKPDQNAATSTSNPHFLTANGELLFKVTNMPAGEQLLTLTVDNSGDSNSLQIPITFIPTPFIQLNNLYNNQMFTSPNQFTTINGNMVNFNMAGAADRSSLSIMINGTTRSASTDASMFNFTQSGGVYTGAFTFTPTPDLQLVTGPNTIQISAVAGTIPVSTTITVYLFPENLPEVVTAVPVPVGALTDPDSRFQLTGELAYTTTEKNLDVIFTVLTNNTNQAVVTIDGEQYVATGNNLVVNGADANKLINLGTVSGGQTRFRIPAIALPEAGTKSITISAVQGTTRSSKTLQITRVRVPYKILSPLLPQEQVINQNFVKISIQAEGADSIVIGKEEMVKGSDDIFRLDVNNLKNGNNIIRFAITTGTTTTNGQLTVTYATQNEVGAQYKTTMPSSGRLSVFNSELALSFPRGTMLKRPETVSQVNSPQIDLFNSQQLLFGIADPLDGRTVKRYNRVGEFVNNVPQDGTLANISTVAFASNVLQGSRANFGYASKLFWVDAGYYDTSATTFKTVDGLHPYATNDAFYLRGQNASKWLVPTQRGTITLTYDRSIVNEAAANLSVWRFSDNTWTNLGGVVNTSRKTVTAPFDGFGYYAVMSMRYSFEDVIGHPYARNQVNSMFSKGIMSAKQPNLFGVYDNITRGEFTTMVVRMLELPLNYDTSANLLTFSDVPPFSVPGALWDYRYIETAARAGIVSGLTPRTFNPGGFLTREQAATIIARAMNLRLGNQTSDFNALAKQFTDAGQVNYYAVSSVQAVTKAKIMNGMPNPLQEGQTKVTYSFSPQSNLNRADMAIISYNVMKSLKKM